MRSQLEVTVPRSEERRVEYGGMLISFSNNVYKRKYRGKIFWEDKGNCGSISTPQSTFMGKKLK